MKKSSRKRWLVAIIAAALLVLVSWLLLQVDNAPAEDVQIRAWCMQVLQSNPNGRAMILQAGTNAVPSLARLTRTQDSLARKVFWAGARKLPGSRRKFLAEHIAPPGAEAVREAACMSLGLLGPQGKEAVPALITALGDEVGRVRTEAGTALFRIGKDSVPPLAQTLASSNPLARTGAANTLALFGTNASVALPELRRNLADVDSAARYAAAYGLACMGSGGVEALVDAAKQQTGQAHDVATAMLTNRFIALQIGATGIFIKTHDQSADVRRQAIEALGYIGADRNLAMIAAMEALKDPVAEVRLAAVTALARTGLSNSDVVDTFTRYLKDENPSVRELAVSSLGKIGPAAESAVPELTRIVESGTAAERNAARQAIVKIRAGK